MLIERDGSIRIGWEVDGYEAVHVTARFRSRAELEAFARSVADVALFHRSVTDLRLALRATHPGAFDLSTRETGSGPGRIIVAFHPPRREGRPDIC